MTYRAPRRPQEMFFPRPLCQIQREKREQGEKKSKRLKYNVYRCEERAEEGSQPQLTGKLAAIEMLANKETGVCDQWTSREREKKIGRIESAVTCRFTGAQRSVPVEYISAAATPTFACPFSCTGHVQAGAAPKPADASCRLPALVPNWGVGDDEHYTEYGVP